MQVREAGASWKVALKTVFKILIVNSLSPREDFILVLSNIWSENLFFFFLKSPDFGSNGIKDKITHHSFSQQFVNIYYINKNRVMNNTIFPFKGSNLEKNQAGKQLQLIV